MSARDIDALIAERVFGWENIHQYPTGSVGTPPGGDATWLPEYSGSLYDAMLVVQNLTATWGHFTVFRRRGEDVKEWAVGFDNGLTEATATARTLPLAICKAALKTFGIEVAEAPAERTAVGFAASHTPEQQTQTP